MKLIKFDLPIDGVRVKNVEELREHFTPEILDHFRSSVLVKWLASRKLQDEIEAVKALEGADDARLLKGLCEIFGIEADDLVIAEILKKPVTGASENLVEQMQYYNQLADSIDSAVYEAVRRNCIVKVESFRTLKSQDLFYKSENFYNVSSDEIKSAQVAPSSGAIIEKYSADDSARSNGDIVGWFQMSAYAEDYCSSWHNFVAVLEQRRKILAGMTEEVKIPLLKKALEERIVLLEEIIFSLKDNENDINAKDCVSDKSKMEKRKNRNQKKLDYIKQLSPEKKAIISKKREGVFRLSLNAYTTENIKEGILIYANDPPDFSNANISSPVTGVIVNTKEKNDMIFLMNLFGTAGNINRKYVEEIDIDISN